MESERGASARNSYRTTPNYEMTERRLLLRGGALDGQSWTGVIAVGKRVFCGSQEWSMDGVYLVTSSVEIGADGEPANVAVPAFATEAVPSDSR